MTADLTQRWTKSIQKVYSGDVGKKLICMAAGYLASRDSLYARLPHIRCPVLWMQLRDLCLIPILSVLVSDKNREQMTLYLVSLTLKRKLKCLLMLLKQNWS